jgi:hypothetical protein
VITAAQKIATHLGRMEVRELYWLLDYAAIVSEKLRTQDVAAAYKKLGPKEQRQVLEGAKQLAEFVWDVLKDLKVGDLAGQMGEDP